MKSDQWVSIPVMAAEAGISGNSVRRYTKRFPDFFMSRVMGGVKKFPPETIELLRRIYSLYSVEGRSRSEIQEIIESEYSQTVEVSEHSDNGGSDTPDTMLTPTGQADMMPAVFGAIERLAGSFERIAAAMERQADNADRIAALEARIDKITRSKERQPIAKKSSQAKKTTRRRPDDADKLHGPDYESQIKERIVHLRDIEGHSWGEIAEILNGEGLPTLRRKGKWLRQTIQKMYYRVRG